MGRGHQLLAALLLLLGSWVSSAQAASAEEAAASSSLSITKELPLRLVDIAGLQGALSFEDPPFGAPTGAQPGQARALQAAGQCKFIGAMHETHLCAV